MVPSFTLETDAHSQPLQAAKTAGQRNGGFHSPSLLLFDGSKRVPKESGQGSSNINTIVHLPSNERVGKGRMQYSLPRVPKIITADAS